MIILLIDPSERGQAYCFNPSPLMLQGLVKTGEERLEGMLSIKSAIERGMIAPVRTGERIAKPEYVYYVDLGVYNTELPPLKLPIKGELGEHSNLKDSRS